MRAVSPSILEGCQVSHIGEVDLTSLQNRLVLHKKSAMIMKVQALRSRLAQCTPGTIADSSSGH